MGLTNLTRVEQAALLRDPDADRGSGCITALPIGESPQD